jgi:hypothetical protein
MAGLIAPKFLAMVLREPTNPEVDVCMSAVPAYGFAKLLPPVNEDTLGSEEAYISGGRKR